MYAQLDQLRTMVATGVGAAPAVTASLSAALADTSIDYGETVPLTGVLRGPDGLALPAAPVDVQTNADGRWLTSKRLTTAPDGTFAGELRPRKRMYVRLRFPGGADLRGATSARLLLRLHPVVTLKRPPRSARRGRRVALAGTVGPRKPWLRVMLQQRIHGRFKTVGSKAVRARRGRFSTSFVPAFRATYRYAVVVRSDDDTDRGSTGWRTLRVG